MANIRLGLLALLSAAAFGVVGCTQPTQAPEGYAIVREHLVFSSKDMEPQIRSRLDYTIIEIDGAPIRREKVPPLVDMQAGALITVGHHRFKAHVEPHVRPADS